MINGVGMPRGGGKARRQVLRAVGVGGVLSAATAAGVVGVAGSSGTQAAQQVPGNTGPFPAAGLGVILAVPDAGEASAFYQAAFNAEVLVAAKTPAGRVFHADLLVNGMVLGVATENPEIGFIAPRSAGQSGSWVTQFVADISSATQQAKAAGASILQEPVALSEFLRHACVQDSFGHTWQTFQALREFTAAELEKALETTMLGA